MSRKNMADKYGKQETSMKHEATRALYMDVICSSETSVDFQRTTLRYKAEDRTLQHVTYSK
jgi:hypothetical protein